MICPAWWDVFEREIEKADPEVLKICATLTTTEINRRKKYVILKNDLVEKYGLNKDFVRANLSVNAASPLLKFSPTAEVRQKATEKVAKALNMERRLSISDVESILQISPPARMAIKPAEIRLPVNPQLALNNAPVPKRTELLTMFYKLAGNSIGVYTELAKKNALEDEYAAFVAGVIIIRKYLDGKLIEAP